MSKILLATDLRARIHAYNKEVNVTQTVNGRLPCIVYSMNQKLAMGLALAQHERIDAKMSHFYISVNRMLWKSLIN